MSAHTRSSIAAAERVEVAERHLAEPGRQGLERLLLLRLTGGGERGERAAVERPERGEHVEALRPAVGLAVPARELDRALVGLGARVGEEHAPAAAEQRVELLGDARLHVVVVEVRDVQQRAGLIGDGVGDRGMRVPERGDREPAEEVEVLACPRCPRASTPSPRTNATGQRP